MGKKSVAKRAATKAGQAAPTKPKKPVVLCKEKTIPLAKWKEKPSTGKWVQDKNLKTKTTTKTASNILKKPTYGANAQWASKDGQLKQYGGDAANVKLGKYGWSADSGYKYDPKEKSHELNLIKAKAEASVLSAQAKSESRYHEVGASGDALAVSAEAAVGAEWSKKAKEVHAKAGASADLVKGSVNGGFKIPLWGDHSLTIGGGVEGQVGASAEIGGHAGWTQKKGYSAGFKAKAGLGLGLGLSFNLGFK